MSNEHGHSHAGGDHGHTHSHNFSHSHSGGGHPHTTPAAAAPVTPVKSVPATPLKPAPATPAPAAHAPALAPSALLIPASPAVTPHIALPSATHALASASSSSTSSSVIGATSAPVPPTTATAPPTAPASANPTVSGTPVPPWAALYDNLLAQLSSDDASATTTPAAAATPAPATAAATTTAGTETSGADTKSEAPAAVGATASAPAAAAAAAASANTTDSAPVKRLLQQIRNSAPFKQHLDSHLTSEISKAFLVQLLGKYTAQVLAKEHLETISKFMKHQIDTVLTRIFRCHGNGNYGVSIFQNLRQARLFALRSALHKRYPLLASEGCASLSRAPVYYLTEGSPVYQSLDRYSWELLTSNHSFRIIPLKKNVASEMMPAPASVSAGADGKTGTATTTAQVMDPTSLGAASSWSMDTEILEKEIDADQRAGRLPCAVLATFGGDINKFHSKIQLDDLDAIRKICDRHQLWLHAEGSSLLLAAATSAPAQMYSLFETADSVCAAPLEWFDVESTTLGVTFLKTTDSHSPMMYHDLPVQLDDFPPLFLLWYQLVTHKVSYISDLVDSHLHAVRYFRQQLTKQSWPVKFGPGNYAASIGISSSPSTHSNLGAGAANVNAVSSVTGTGTGAVTHTTPHLLFFQLQSTGSVPLSVFNLDRNVLNKYIWSRISARIRPEHALISTIYQSQFGFLFQPLTNSAAGGSSRPISTTQIDQLIADIGYELKLLDLAGSLREEFKTAISTQKELQYVPPSSIEHAFVGIGAFRLVPAFPIPVQQANALNVVLAHALAKNNPSLFAIAMTSADKLVCTVVRTSPLVMDKNCVTILISEILDAAARLELPKEVVDQLSKVVQRGIREAEAKLQSTSTEAYYPTTLIRKLPVVGSVWNWFSPPVKTDTTQPAGWQLDIRSQELSKPKISVAAGSGSTTPAHTPPSAASTTTTTTTATGTTPPAAAAAAATAGTAPSAAATPVPVTPAKPVATTTTPPAGATSTPAPAPTPAPTPAPAIKSAESATTTATAIPTALAVPNATATPTPAPAPTHTAARGGVGLELLPPDKAITDVFYSVASAFHSRLNLPTDRATAIIGYAKQVVAGINYFVIVQIDTNEFVHARIFSSFRNASGQHHTELVGIRTGVKRDDPLTYF